MIGCIDKTRLVIQKFNNGIEKNYGIPHLLIVMGPAVSGVRSEVKFGRIQRYILEIGIKELQKKYALVYEEAVKNKEIDPENITEVNKFDEKFISDFITDKLNEFVKSFPEEISMETLERRLKSGLGYNGGTVNEK